MVCESVSLYENDEALFLIALKGCAFKARRKTFGPNPGGASEGA
jgi:hypothetical protein